MLFAQISGTVWDAAVSPFVKFAVQHGLEPGIRKSGIEMLLDIKNGFFLFAVLKIVSKNGVYSVFFVRIFDHPFFAVYDAYFVS